MLSVHKLVPPNFTLKLLPFQTSIKDKEKITQNYALIDEAK